MQTVAALREVCARLPHSGEIFPFGPDTLVFKVGGRVYALADIAADPLTLSLKVRPERGEELRAAHPAIVPGHHLNKRHWITLTLDGRVPDGPVRDLLSGSHALVVAGLIRIPSVSCRNRNRTDSRTPRPESVFLLLASLGFSGVSNTFQSEFV